ncbi:hypothetical protein H9Q69_003320 [Fusarium xylarioides]|nr:hypothetical protein H9Q69_003320 [Fusarium xylarioides]
MSFRNVNAKAHSSIETALDCKEVLEHGHSAFVNIIRASLSRNITIGEIHLALTSSKCGFCEEYHEPPNRLSHHQQRHTMISAPLQQWRSTHPQCARAEASSTNLIIILGMMQVSKRVPFDDPFVLNVVRAVYLASSALPHPEEFISVMHEGCATWDLHKLHQVTSTKRPGVDMGESTGQR